MKNLSLISHKSNRASRPEMPDQVLPGLLPGTVGFLVAAGSTGKSFLALETAMSVAAGVDLFHLWTSEGGELSAGPAVYIGQEDPEAVLRLRHFDASAYLLDHGIMQADDEIDDALEERLILAAPRTDEPTIRIASYVEGRLPEKTQEWLDLIQWLRALNPRLVILDTLNRFIPGLDESSNPEMSLVMRYIEELARLIGTAVLIVHHTNKSSQFSGNAEATASRGADALAANARWQANATTMTTEEAKGYELGDEEERKRWVKLSVPKLNYATSAEPRWCWRDDGGILVGKAGPKKKARQESRSGKGPKERPYAS